MRTPCDPEKGLFPVYRPDLPPASRTSLLPRPPSYWHLPCLSWSGQQIDGRFPLEGCVSPSPFRQCATGTDQPPPFEPFCFFFSCRYKRLGRLIPTVSCMGRCSLVWSPLYLLPPLDRPLIVPRKGGAHHSILMVIICLFAPYLAIVVHNSFACWIYRRLSDSLFLFLLPSPSNSGRRNKHDSSFVPGIFSQPIFTPPGPSL